MGLLKILFVALCITFPFGVLVRISLIPQAYVYLVDLIVMVFVLYGVSLLITSKRKILWFGEWKFFLIAAVVSLLFNVTWLQLHDIVVSSLYLTRLILYLLMIPIVSSFFTKKDLSLILGGIFFALSITVLGGLVQYFIYPDLRNLMYMGWDEHLFRIFSSFLDPNFASILFCLGFWIGVLYLRITNHKEYVKYFIYILIALTSVAILLTYSRTGYLAWVSSLFVYIVLTKNLRMLCITIIFLIAGLIALPKDIKSEGVNLLRTASIYSRLDAYGTSISIIQKYPIFGVGFNAYRYAVEKIAPSEKIEISHAGAGVSNSYLFILATTGIVGLVAFLKLLFEVGKQIAKLSQKNVKVIFTSIATVVLIGSLTENILFYSFVLIILACLFGVLKILTEKSGR